MEYAQVQKITIFHAMFLGASVCLPHVNLLDCSNAMNNKPFLFDTRLMSAIAYNNLRTNPKHFLNACPNLHIQICTCVQVLNRGFLNKGIIFRNLSIYLKTGNNWKIQII